mgnify:CR=1 FL=1
MSASLINRSLTNIRTELDFLRESNVISDDLFNKINDSLPQRYNPNSSRDSVASSAQVEYVEAIYDFPPQQDGDLELKTGDKVEVIEKPSSEWYKGKCNGKTGMFPSNYVKPAFSNPPAPSRDAASINGPPKYGNNDNKLQHEYTNNSSSQVSYQQPPQQQQQQAPFPPASTNYYQAPPPQQQVVYQQQPQQPQQVIVQQPQEQHSHSSMKKFGSKLGNAAIFGAGATLGSDLVNSIF